MTTTATTTPIRVRITEVRTGIITLDPANYPDGTSHLGMLITEAKAASELPEYLEYVPDLKTVITVVVVPD